MTPIHEHFAAPATATASLPHVGPSTPAWRKGRPSISKAALPMAAFLTGALLPATLLPATAIAPEILACSVLLGAVALPALDGPVNDKRTLPGTLAATFAFAFLSPAFTALACTLAAALSLTVPGDLQWATLSAAAPVSIGAVVTARTLGLGQRRMAGYMVLSTLSVPFVIPQLAWAFGITSTAGVEALTWTVAETSGVPLLIGLALRSCPAMARPRIRLGAARGSFAALMLLGVLRGIGLGSVVVHDMAGALQSAGIAAVVALCGITATWFVVRRWPDAVLAGVFRSNTLVWASMAGVITEKGTLLMSLCTLWSYGAPVLARLALGTIRPAVRSSTR